MNEKLKYTLAFIVVLLIGFVLGFLVSGRLIHNKVNRLQKYYTSRGFRYEMRHVLHLSAAQLEKMQPVLKKYAGENRENMLLFRERQKQIMDSLFLDLKPYLTAEQQQRFEMLKRRRMRFIKNRQASHPRGNVRNRP
jgi:hypothetical protein